MGSDEDILLGVIAERLGRIDPLAEIGNGTPLAEATATLLARDLRRAGRQLDEDLAIYGALTDAALSETMATVRRALEESTVQDQPPRATELPLATGGSIHSWSPGEIMFDGGSWVGIGGIPGLHTADVARGAPVAERLSRLRARLTVELGRLGVRQEVDVTACERSVGRLPQRIELAGLLSVPDTRLAMPLPRHLQSMLDFQIDDLATETARYACAFRSHQRKVARMAAIATRALRSAEVEYPLRSLGVVFVRTPWHGLTSWSSFLMLETLADNLRPQVEAYEFSSLSGLMAGLEYPLEAEAERQALLERLRVSNATHLIDAIAMRAMESVPDGVELTLAALDGSTARVAIDVPTSDGGKIAISVGWHNGRVSAVIERSRVLFNPNNDHLIVEAAHLPDTIVLELPGRRLGQVIDIPCLAEFRIEKAFRDASANLFLKVDLPRFLHRRKGRKDDHQATSAGQ